MRVGFIGLGRMGARMAERLRQAGHPIMVWNRTPERAEPFRARGVHVADTPAEVASRSDVVHLMLTDAAAVKDVLFGDDGVVHGLSTEPRPPFTPPDNPDVIFNPREGLIVVDHSTIAPHESQGVSDLLSSKGVRYLDAPVVGSVDAAETGSLEVLVGGPPGLVTLVTPLLNALGDRVIPMGPVGSGTTMKAVINLQLGAQVAALAEGLSVAFRAGINPQAATEAILADSITSPTIRAKLPLVLDEDFSTRFPTRYMAKDMAIFAVTASREDVDAPLARAARAAYETATAQGLGDQDFASVWHMYQGSHAAETVGEVPPAEPRT